MVWGLVILVLGVLIMLIGLRSFVNCFITIHRQQPALPRWGFAAIGPVAGIFMIICGFIICLH